MIFSIKEGKKKFEKKMVKKSWKKSKKIKKKKITEFLFFFSNSLLYFLLYSATSKPETLSICFKHNL